MIASRGGMHTYDVIMYRPLRTGHCVDMTVTFLNGGQYGTDLISVAVTHQSPCSG